MFMLFFFVNNSLIILNFHLNSNLAACSISCYIDMLDL